MSGLVAVCSRSFSQNGWLREQATARFGEVRFNDGQHTLEGEALRAFLDGAQRAIIGLERVDRSLLRELPGLRVLAKYGVGLDRIDLHALEDHGVRLGWTPGVNCHSVAELALGFALVLLRRLQVAQRNLIAGAWAPERGRTLSSSVVGIVGCGHVGSDLVRLLAPFGCEILVHDIRTDLGFAPGEEPERVDLDTLLERSDVVTIHLPLDASTAGILDAARLARMKDGALLVNTARGGLVDEVALYAELASGRLGGAAFDVFEIEPLTAHPLLELPTFIGSPHIGGSTEEAVRAMGVAAMHGLEHAREITELRKLIERA